MQRCAPWPRKAAPWIRCAWPCWLLNLADELSQTAAADPRVGHARAANLRGLLDEVLEEERRRPARKQSRLARFGCISKIALSKISEPSNVAQCATLAQDLQFRAEHPTIRNRNRPAKQVGDQRWLNQHSLNRGSTRQSVLCAVSASPECLMNRGELHRLRTGSPAHRPRPSGSGSTSFSSDSVCGCA